MKDKYWPGREYPGEAAKRRSGEAAKRRSGEAADPRNHAATRYRNGNIDLSRLWAYYCGIGGSTDELTVDAYLHEMMELPRVQMDLIHHAFEEIAAEGP